LFNQETFYYIVTLFSLAAQRLAAQPPGRFRFVAIILAGFLQLHSSVFSLSLGQVGCSRVLGVFNRLTVYSHLLL
jgi:hypothetical protein